MNLFVRYFKTVAKKIIYIPIALPTCYLCQTSRCNKITEPYPAILSLKAVVPQRGKTNGKSWNRDIWPRFTMARAFLLPKFPCTHRGLIHVYTEQKWLGRLNKMCYPFFYEFRVIPTANRAQLVCYTASLFTTEAVC
jgi:hypothetical protein